MSTNILVWNPTGSNQESDATYNADPQRSGGATNPSVFDALLANKAFFQWSTVVSALCQAMAANNFTMVDSNIAQMIANFQHVTKFRSLFVSTATQSVTNSTAVTSMIPSGTGSMTLQANYFYAVGQKIRLLAEGIYGLNNAAVPTISIEMKIGSNTLTPLTSTSPPQAPNYASVDVKADITITCLSISGGNATLQLGGSFIFRTANPDAAVSSLLVFPFGAITAVIPIASSALIDLLAQWSAASTSNNITIYSASLIQEN